MWQVGWRRVVSQFDSGSYRALSIRTRSAEYLSRRGKVEPMPNVRDVYNRSFRVAAHGGDNQVCIQMRQRDAEAGVPWRRVHCFHTDQALAIARQLLDAVDENLRRRDAQ